MVRKLLIFAFLPSVVIGEIDYLTEVKPLLASRCFDCHGGLKQKAKLRVDTVKLMLQGEVIVPGKPEDSELLHRIASDDPDELMPPDGEGVPFTADEIKTIRGWIQAGAPAPKDEVPEADPKDHWAFRSIAQTEIPNVNDHKWGRNPIDAFILRKQEQRGLVPQPEVTKLELIRRIYLDLIGLPPNPEELEALLSDSSSQWYETLVQKLLEDPRYGERWGRHWMDVWRYSDWWGLGKQMRFSQKHIWHWRDWIVESLNEDLPYDEMVRLMLAVDELHPEDQKKLRASGYLARNFFLFNRNAWMDNTIEHVGKGFLGLTTNCAKCHDHKFDPISMNDYYSLRAIFEPYHVRLDMVPGESDYEKNGIPRAFDTLLDAPTYLFIRGNEATPEKSKVITPNVPAFLSKEKLKVDPVNLPPVAWQPERQPGILETFVEVAQKKLEGERAKVEKAKEDVATAEKKWKELKDEPEPQQETPMPMKGPSDSLVSENFDTLDPFLWKTIGGKWKHKPGKLEQLMDGAQRSRLRYLEEVPQDFDATFHFQIKGGSNYRSVGIAFDVPSEKPDTITEQLVYISVGGSKVQAAYKKAGKWSYPRGEAVHSMKIKESMDYRLRVQVRGTLLNVALNGKPVLAWRTPLARTKGTIELITFDALAELLGFQLSKLDPQTTLVESNSPSKEQPTSREEAKLALTKARHQLELAQQNLLIANTEWMSVRFRAKAWKEAWAGKENSASRKHAIQSERKLAVAKAQSTFLQAEHKLALGAGNKKKELEAEVKKAADALKKAEEKVALEIKETDTFAKFSGAKWTPTRFKFSGKDDKAVDFKKQSTGRRTALANWITDKQNPLAARVAVNHIWLRHIGQPLVPTVFDFGRKGTPPTHPELLDWLAMEFMEKGWSMKHLHKLIVTSSTYRMGSSLAGAEKSLKIDPDNEHLWHRPAIRLESQVVRDSILSLAGDLDLTMGGPSIPMNQQANSKRRSLYFFHSNNERNLFLMMFDEARVKECYRREQSIIPQQALALTNSKLVLEAAPKIAKKLDRETDQDFIKLAFLSLLGIEAREAELQASLKALEDWRKLPKATPKTARNHFVWALLNHNDFVTLR